MHTNMYTYWECLCLRCCVSSSQHSLLLSHETWHSEDVKHIPNTHTCTYHAEKDELVSKSCSIYDQWMIRTFWPRRPSSAVILYNSWRRPTIFPSSLLLSMFILEEIPLFALGQLCMQLLIHVYASCVLSVLAVRWHELIQVRRNPLEY